LKRNQHFICFFERLLLSSQWFRNKRVMLYIYKASAGSGKTHLLTGFFLQLLFKKPVEVDDGKRPLLFNEILAVTFTNKATAEMKERIIKELHTLYTQPEESDFIEALMESEGGEKALTIEQIRRRAFAILNAILNDYSELHVSTIDSFFQQVLRSFAHELNLQGNFEIELFDNLFPAIYKVNAFVASFKRCS